MKRRLVIACVTLALAALPVLATCAPLSDVSRGDWAFQAIQTLVAHGILDGYPDGTFKGDQPPTRNEMAALTARALAKVEADGASKADLEKVQTLVDALKDELDALGVRVTNIEDALGSLEGRTKRAQRSMSRTNVQRQPKMHDRTAGAGGAWLATFRGDRRLTRSEMVALTAHAIAKFEADGASKGDVENEQRLIQALKDKLDMLGARVTNIEAGDAQHSTKVPQPSILGADLQSQLAIFLTRFGQLDAFGGSLAGLTFQATENATNVPSQADFRATLRTTGRLVGLSDLYFSVIRVDRPLLYQSTTTGKPIVDFDGARTSEEIKLVFALPGPSGVLSPTNGALTDNLIGERVFGVSAIVPMPQPSGLRAALQGQDAGLPAYRGLDADVPLTPLSREGSAIVAGISFRPSFSSVAPHQYVASAPSLVALDAHSYSPRFSGLANSVVLNDGVNAAANFDLRGASANPSPSSAVSLFDQLGLPGQGFYSPSSPNTQGLRLNVSLPLRVGAFVVRGYVGGAHALQTTSNAFSAIQNCSEPTAGCVYALARPQVDDQLSAGTALDVRALGRRISLNLGGSYERLYRPEQTVLPALPYDPAAQSLDAAPAPAGGISPGTFTPNYLDVSRRTLDAAAAVPLTNDLTLNLQYNTQYYTGSYETLGQNVDERQDFYLGNLTYTIPRTSSSIVLSAKQYHYRDAFVPTYNLTQNRADLNFTIKF